MSTYRPRGSEIWRMEEQEDGTVDVWLGRRRRLQANGLIEAIRFIRGQRQPPQRVKHVEPDGYETDVTRRFITRR